MIRSSMFVLLAFLSILSASSLVSAAHTSPSPPLEAIDSDLMWFQEQGWEDLYEEDNFDCSRMTVFFWDFLRRKHGIDADIIVNFGAEHAWLGIPADEVNATGTVYPQFTLKQVYYYVESTSPFIVSPELEERYQNLTQGAMIFDDPLEVVYYTCNGFYLSNDFRLTYPDLVKIRTILPDYTPT